MEWQGDDVDRGIEVGLCRHVCVYMTVCVIRDKSSSVGSGHSYNM